MFLLRYPLFKLFHIIINFFRYLATGCTLTELHYSFRIGVSTLSSIIREMCNAIWTNLRITYMPEPKQEDWLKIADTFLNVTNFPNCIGAIDGKHIRIVKPAHSGTLYYNYKHFFSTVLLAVCDANYCFTAVDIGDYGKNSDSSIFKNSTFYRKLFKKELNIPENTLLPQSNGSKFPFVIVGDEAFGLSQNVMRPYGGRHLSTKKKVFNYRLSRARRFIECTFGILSNKWRIFHRPLNVSEEFAYDIIKACVILHNFVRIRDGNTLEFEDTLFYEGLLDEDRSPDNTSGKAATNIRDDFADYFMGAGEVPWQYESIKK